jgi:hypothetical protein
MALILADVSFPSEDRAGCVKVRTNLYSAPVDVGKTVEVWLSPNCVEIWHEGRCLARHERQSRIWPNDNTEGGSNLNIKVGNAALSKSALAELGLRAA